MQSSRYIKGSFSSKNNKKSTDLARFNLTVDKSTSVSIENTNKTLYNSCKAIWTDTKENIKSQ